MSARCLQWIYQNLPEKKPKISIFLAVVKNVIYLKKKLLIIYYETLPITGMGNFPILGRGTPLNIINNIKLLWG